MPLCLLKSEIYNGALIPWGSTSRKSGGHAIDEAKNHHLEKTSTGRLPYQIIRGAQNLKSLEQEIGKRLTVNEVANFLGIDKKTVRENYDKLGGMRLGRLYLFFERSVINAIQKETQMDSPSTEGWEEEGESVSDEKTGFDLGGQKEAKTRQRVEREDRQNFFG